MKLPVELDPDQISTVCVRNFNATDDLKIRDKAIRQTVVTDPVKLAALPNDATDEQKAECVTLTRTISEYDFCVEKCLARLVAWDGFKDANNNALPLTRVNVIAFAGEPGFFDWLEKMGKLVDKLALGALKDEEKNSLNSARVAPGKANLPKTAKSA